MNALVVKEIRLLLPAYVLALLLALASAAVLLLIPPDNALRIFTSALPFFGALFLALSSFGREFGTGTFSLLLAQPVPRSRIWWTKIIILCCALATVFGAFYFSMMVGTHFDPIWFEQRYQTTAKLSIIFLVILASGLWAALLLRQMLAAFWMALLIPAGILMMVAWMQGTELTGYIALGLYSIVAFAWAGIYFLRAQEVAWTGSAITLPGWQSLGIGARSDDNRSRRPIAALFLKEFQFYQTALLGMGGLFVLHLGIVFLRKMIPPSKEDPLLTTALEMFGGIWLIVPLLTASLSVAEERRMGTLEGQLCLPVSTRIQFGIKLLFALALSGGLSALLLCTAEGIGPAMGARPGMLGVEIILNHTLLGVLSFAISLPTALITFYASTLTRNFLQAMAAAVGTGIVLLLVWALIGDGPYVNADTKLWGKPLLGIILWPAMVVALIWLAHRNFRRLSEPRRLWFYNARAIMCVMAGSVAFAAAVYNRIWEFIPLEPAHGPVRWSAAQPPTILSDNSRAVSILLPDGRFWQDFLSHDSGRMLLVGKGAIPDITIGAKWIHLTRGQMMGGSNWVSVADNYYENVGILSDGTLWASQKPMEEFNGGIPGGPFGLSYFVDSPQPRAKMIKVGGDTDWKKVVRGPDHSSMILLKADGSLWRWPAGWKNDESKHASMPLSWEASEPHRLNAKSNWVDLLSGNAWPIAWDKDDRAWRFHAPYNIRGRAEILMDPGLAIERFEALDHTHWRALTMGLGIREDGTLWTMGGFRKPPGQVGKASDWIAVAAGSEMLVAAKSDGTLWKWDCLHLPDRERAWPLDQPPARLGSRTDWVTVGSCNNGIVSLSANGSLWYWWRSESSENYFSWLAPTRKPEKIENLFGEP